jgi:hypothetical protein
MRVKRSNHNRLALLNRRSFRAVKFESVRVYSSPGRGKLGFNQDAFKSVVVSSSFGRRMTVQPPSGLSRISATVVSKLGIKKVRLIRLLNYRAGTARRICHLSRRWFLRNWINSIRESKLIPNQETVGCLSLTDAEGVKDNSLG